MNVHHPVGKKWVATPTGRPLYLSVKVRSGRERGKGEKHQLPHPKAIEFDDEAWCVCVSRWPTRKVAGVATTNNHLLLLTILYDDGATRETLPNVNPTHLVCLFGDDRLWWWVTQKIFAH